MISVAPFPITICSYGILQYHFRALRRFLESESGYSEIEPSFDFRYFLTMAEAPRGLMFELKSNRSGEGFFTEYLPP